MALPHHYVLALISPSGRLGQFHFALLACLIAFAHIYIYGEMAGLTSNDPWNTFSIALLALIWCKFCILSRRLHDTGSNGLIAIPVLLISVALYLFIIDPSFAGDTADLDAGTAWLLEQGMLIPRVIFIAAFIYCIRAPSDTGPNAYGPEFGDTADVVAGARASLDKKRDSTMPQHGYKVFRDEDPGWGRRRRPAGFGRR